MTVHNITLQIYVSKLCVLAAAHLAVVVPLLDELVHYLLSLSVTLLLQVCDEGVQMTWTVVRLYDGLVRLHHTSNACKQ